MAATAETTTGAGSTGAPYRAGFDSLENEVTFDSLPVSGSLPEWLEGTLIRNGPARFEVGGSSMNHWFDGLAMLHKFSFAGGRVSYANRFLRTRANDAAARGEIGYREFATDPCRSLFGRAASLFSPRFTDNCNVNLMRLGRQAIAMTETPLPISFDPTTLESMGVAYEPPGQLTTAHPHHDPSRNEAINYATHFGPRSAYRLFGIGPGRRGPRRIATVGVRRPAYMHSFAVTERYAILVEFPLVVSPIRLALSGPARRPFIRNYEWDSGRGSRFLLIDRDAGRLAHEIEGPPLFAFHHVNAFQRGSEVVVDLAGYEDAAIVESLYLDRLRAGDPIPLPTLRRFRLSLEEGSVFSEPISDEAIELPRIHYRDRNGRPYRYVYGVGASAKEPGFASTDFLNQLVKVDVDDGRAAVWRREGGYPGEPVFVPAPNAASEDDGVLLSVVLDAHRSASSLVVLDARSLEELAAAQVPHAIPFGFHGQHLASDPQG